MFYFLDEIMPIVFLVLILFVTIAIPTMVYISAVNDAKIINRAFGTRYTGWQMFLSGDTIKETLIGKKQRVDLEIQ